MFIVARRKGQKIVIGNDIEIIVTELSRTTVKLGILAPKPYAILRGEIQESIEKANREALSAVRESSDDAPSVHEGQGPVDAHLINAATFLGRPVKTVSPEDVKPETVP